MIIARHLTHSLFQTPRLLSIFSVPVRPYSKVPFGRRNSYIGRFKKMTDNGPLVWVDCEMTGLDAMNDHIIEVCCLLTDGDLNIIEEVCILFIIFLILLILFFC